MCRSYASSIKMFGMRSRRSNKNWPTQRPHPGKTRSMNARVLAGLMKCGRCGSGYTLISKDLLGCAAARNKGTCNNRLNIRRDTLEGC